MTHDSRIAKIWSLYTGDMETRTKKYRKELLEVLEAHGVKSVYDVACGNGVDSVLLLDAGYEVASSDSSYAMIKLCQDVRWERRAENRFEEWKLGVADWLNLNENTPDKLSHPTDGYDAILCIGNSFTSLPDPDGNQIPLKKALRNFYDLLKIGGILIIDHRNMDYIIKHKKRDLDSDDIYYNGERMFDNNTILEFTEGKCSKVIMTRKFDLTGTGYEVYADKHFERDGKLVPVFDCKSSQYPHTRDGFASLLKSVFGYEATYQILPDFKSDVKGNPVYWVHVIRKDTVLYQNGIS